MNEERLKQLYENALSLIADHCLEELDYAFDLKTIGLDDEEIKEELKRTCCLNSDGIKEIMDKLGD